MNRSSRIKLRGWGYCICPRCGEKIVHPEDRSCHKEHCPNCGSKMIRDGYHHHQLIEQKHNKNTTKIQDIFVNQEIRGNETAR